MKNLIQGLKPYLIAAITIFLLGFLLSLFITKPQKGIIVGVYLVHNSDEKIGMLYQIDTDGDGMANETYFVQDEKEASFQEGDTVLFEENMFYSQIKIEK